MMLKLVALLLAALTLVNSATPKMSSHDREHLQSHAQGQLDLSAMSEEELRFLYFQAHDYDGNHKLDGCELIQSLLHFHAEESTLHGQPDKVFTEAELSAMIDPILEATDTNLDGLVDYQEFAAGPGVISY